MNAPTPSIAKKKSNRAQKVQKLASSPTCPEEKTTISPQQISPVSIQKNSEAVIIPCTNQTSQTSGTARHKLNFSKINLSAIAKAASQPIYSIGGVTRHAKEALEKRETGTCRVNLYISPIRMPKNWDGFVLFPIVDHTGVMSIGANGKVFDELQAFADKAILPALKITGNVHFKWSTKTKGEIFFSMREGYGKVTISEGNAIPQVFSAFHTIRYVVTIPYYANASFSRVIGDCVLAQSDGDTRSFMLQDSTGFALINVLNYGEICSEVDEKSEYGAVVVEGRLKFEVANIDGVDGITTTVEGEDISITHVRNQLLTRHINLVKNTAKEDYQFSFDDNAYDIRS